MNFNLVPVLPEISLVVMILLILLVDTFMDKSTKPISMWLTQIALIIAFVLQLTLSHLAVNNNNIFNGMFILDKIAIGLKLFTYIVGFVIILYSKQYLADKDILKGEFYAIYLFAILGMLVMMSANNLLVLYVGLELLSLALYGLVALNRDNNKAIEAAMKFFILGALASGILLYGISFIYGATGGCLQLDQIFIAIYRFHTTNHALLVFGLVFIVAGLAFKLGLVPFHMWIPDVYEGALLPVTTIIGTVTKVASVLFILRFLVNGLMLLDKEWSVMLLVLAYLSLFFGNIIAIAQTNIKRMLGYSAISHMGFVVLGILTVSALGLSATIFYVVTYVLTALAGFGILMIFSRGNYECESIDDLRGLGKTHPVWAMMMLFVMFSMAGIPPFIGFYAKFTILEALVSLGYVNTAIFAVLMSLIGAFYYLRVVKVMYFEDNKIDLRVSESSLLARTTLMINSLLLLIFGIFPAGIMYWCLHIL